MIPGQGRSTIGGSRICTCEYTSDQTQPNRKRTPTISRDCFLCCLGVFFGSARAASELVPSKPKADAELTKCWNREQIPISEANPKSIVWVWSNQHTFKSGHRVGQSVCCLIRSVILSSCGGNRRLRIILYN